MKLSPSQSRYLRASLLVFEKSLRKSKRILDENHTDGFLFNRSISLDGLQRSQIYEKLELALELLRLVIKKFGLEPSDEYAENIIFGEMSMSWTSLVECQSKHFKGYGKMDPKLSKILDAEIEPLVEISNDICNLISSYVEEKKADN